MKPYHLAKLIQWAPGGELKSRKRMQKVVFLLQAAGCKALEADFTLHHYGPYSQDVAALTDQMVAGDLLKEEELPNAALGSSYSYRLTPRANTLRERLEREVVGNDLAAAVEPFKSKAANLLQADLKELEYAATIVYFYQRTNSWEQAMAKACEFKKLDKTSPAASAAFALAQGVLKRS